MLSELLQIFMLKFVFFSLFMSDVVEVQQAQKKPKFWRSKKPETVELVPNTHAVIHMDTLDNHNNVVALVPLNQSSQTRAQFFTSKDLQVVSNLKGLLSRCCDGKFLWKLSVLLRLNLHCSMAEPHY